MYSSRFRTSVVARANRRTCVSSHGHQLLTVPRLDDDSLETFTSQCWVPEAPALLPRGTFNHLPAFERWFVTSESKQGGMRLSQDYFQTYRHVSVPLEFTRRALADPAEDTFERIEAPLALFLDWVQNYHASTKENVYLAQASIARLPLELRNDLPTPDLVAQAGRGDIYDTNIWIGIPPTYTPLHRDPNPNLLLQLAGTKLVRLVKPSIGADIFREVQEKLGQNPSNRLRNHEMMQGEEKRLFEDAIWHSDHALLGSRCTGYECRLERGDGIFIPKGWWHSIKGVGDSITASVNWWFR